MYLVFLLISSLFYPNISKGESAIFINTKNGSRFYAKNFEIKNESISITSCNDKNHTLSPRSKFTWFVEDHLCEKVNKNKFEVVVKEIVELTKKIDVSLLIYSPFQVSCKDILVGIEEKCNKVQFLQSSSLKVYIKGSNLNKNDIAELNKNKSLNKRYIIIKSNDS